MRVMSFKALLTLSVIALAPTLSQTASAGDHYSVELNKTEVVYLPSSAGAVVIGNPEIADVSVHSSNTIFVVGRGYGETNLVVLDSVGHKIMDANIQVVNNIPPHGVRLYNGNSRETYNCAPYCQPAPVLGDSRAFISSNQNAAPTITNNIASGLPSSASSSAVSSSSLSGPSAASGPSNQSFGSGTAFPEN